MDIRLYWIRLAQALGAGNPAMFSLMQAFPHPRNLFEASEAELQKRGVKPELCKAILAADAETAKATLERAEKRGMFVLTPDDALYPEGLLNLPDFPAVLYGMGDWRGLADTLAICVVGPRSISAQGNHRTRYLTAGLVAGGATIIAGGAKGGDAAAMETAVECGGQCIVVQAVGLDVNYPTETTELRERILAHGGVLLSEYPPGTRVGRGTFFVRNRLMSGLAQGTLVTESLARSGTLITAHRAREQGRDVFAVPGDENLCAGCHNLIREGAILTTRSTDVLSEYILTHAEQIDLAAAYAAEEEFRARPLPDARAKRGLRLTKLKEAVVTALTADEPPKPMKKPASKTAAVSKKPPAPVAPPQGVSVKAEAVFTALSEHPLALDDIAKAATLSVSETLAALTELEMFGCVQSFAGRQYARKGD